MCGRYAVTSEPETFRQLMRYLERPNFPPRYNIAPTQPVPIVRLQNGDRHFALVRWGLVPGWAKEMPKTPLINARSETVNEKPSFRGGYRHRRCLFPADGFYEWRTEGRGQKQPYLIRRKDRQPFAMAGIWEDWLTADGSELDSAAILTTIANDTLRPIHHRMPVILEAQDWDQWLDISEPPKKAIEALMRPAAEELLEAVPVSKDVNRIANDHVALMDKVDVELDAEAPKQDQGRQRTKKDDQLDLF